MFAQQNVSNTFKSSLHVLSWSTMGTQRGRVIFSRVLRDSSPRYVGRLVGQSVGPLFGQRPQRADVL